MSRALIRQSIRMECLQSRLDAAASPLRRVLGVWELQPAGTAGLPTATSCASEWSIQPISSDPHPRSSIFQFLKANFFRPPSLLFDQPSRKHPHRLPRSSTSRVNSQDGYVRLNFFEAFVCKWTIGNGLCEYEGAANSSSKQGGVWIERAGVVTDLLPASAAALTL